MLKLPCVPVVFVEHLFDVLLRDVILVDHDRPESLLGDLSGALFVEGSGKKTEQILAALRV